MAAMADEGHELHVGTCFTRSVSHPTGFALECQLDKGLFATVDYMQIRREEDQTACAHLQAEPHWLDLPEAPHRGYTSAAMLFGDLTDQDDVQAELSVRVDNLIQKVRPDVVLSPVGIGQHVDHQQLCQTVVTLRQKYSEAAFFRWYDEPYLTRYPTAWPTHAKVQPTPNWTLVQKQLTSTDSAVCVDIESVIDRKLTACSAYVTQLGFQFGGVQRLKSVFTKTKKPSFGELLQI